MPRIPGGVECHVVSIAYLPLKRQQRLTFRVRQVGRTNRHGPRRRWPQSSRQELVLVIGVGVNQALDDSENKRGRNTEH